MNRLLLILLSSFKHLSVSQSLGFGRRQISHKMVMFQWQDGKKVIVWPDELAPGKPRFPTPVWTHR
jgi:hypothetical protein